MMQHTMPDAGVFARLMRAFVASCARIY